MRSASAVQNELRKDLGDVTRQFQQSTNLTSWTPASPLSVTTVQDLVSNVILQATFAASSTSAWYRLNFSK